MSQKLMLVQNILAARCVASQCVEVAWGHTPRKMVGEHISEADGGSQCVGGSDKRRTLLIPSLSPAAMVVLVQADLWADWSVMTTPPLWFQRLPCTVSFSSPWSPSSASSKFNVWVWRCFLNAPVLYHKGHKYDDDSEDMTDMTDHTKQTKYDNDCLICLCKPFVIFQGWCWHVNHDNHAWSNLPP